MMEEREKNQDKEEGGGLRDLLHNKARRLPSLRTYQGDVAEFIKEKDQSVVGVVIKEKEKKEKRERIEPKTKESRPVNVTMIILSLVLILGGALAVLYSLNFLNQPLQESQETEFKIFPYNNILTLANTTPENLGEGLDGLTPISGVSLIKISDPTGNLIKTAPDFFEFLDVSLPPSLDRNLDNDFMVGVFSQNDSVSYFLIIKTRDFGSAFEALLDWEKNLDQDLSFLSSMEGINPPLAQTFEWKDAIVKNKDTRALQDQYGHSALAYTFLDKNTILIVGEINIVGELSSLYASRAFTR